MSKSTIFKIAEEYVAEGLTVMRLRKRGTYIYLGEGKDPGRVKEANVKGFKALYLCICPPQAIMVFYI